MKLSPSLIKLARYLNRLPGVGEKSSLRMALFLLRSEGRFTEELATCLQDVRERVAFCTECFALKEEAICSICSDPQRDTTTLCVVEDIADLIAIEQTHPRRWHYHVLHGALSPLDGITPAHLKIQELHERVQRNPQWTEMILATNPCVEGEATASYLVRMLESFPLRLTRIAQGIPLGSQLEYIDQATLGRALTERQTISKPLHDRSESRVNHVTD